MLSTTLQYIAVTARARGEFLDPFITDIEMLRYGWEGIQALHDLVLSIEPNYYLSSATFSTVADTQDYDATTWSSTDVYSIHRVDIATQSTQTEDALTYSGWIPMDSYNLRDELMYEPINGGPGGSDVYQLRWAWSNNSIRIAPTPKVTTQVRVWYTPDPALPDNDYDVFYIPIPSMEEWLIWHVTILCGLKEEAPQVPAWMKMKDACEQRIIRSIKRSQTTPSVVRPGVDLSTGARWSRTPRDRYGWRG